MPLRTVCLLAVLVLSNPLVAVAQFSSVDAERLGMESAWQTQVQIPRVGRGVVSAELWVEPVPTDTAENALTHKVAVAELPTGKTIRVSADELDAENKPIGIEEAKKRASVQAARLLGRNTGFEVVETTLSQIRLVIVTSDGLVQNFDAETGKLIWSTTCGPTYAPAHPAALSSAGVALIQGSQLFLLDWESGKQLLYRDLRFSSSSALATCGKLAYVSDFSGRMEAYGLGETIKPWRSQIIGRSGAQPVSLRDESFCAIASTSGYVYTLKGGTSPTIWTRYETSASMSGSLAAGNGAFYAGTSNGILTKIGMDERIGRLNWEYPTGETITAPALVIGNRVYVTTESGALHCIDDESGFGVWSNDRMRILQPLVVAGGNVLCSTLSGEIRALNALDGREMGRTLPLNTKTTVSNQISDRLYAIGSAGQLQCLRPIGSLLPKMVTPAVATEAAPAEEAATTPPAATPATDNPFNFGGETAAPPANNPFGASNPFGGTEPAPAEAGGTANPFGAGTTDPFGGANPFGTGK